MTIPPTQRQIKPTQSVVLMKQPVIFFDEVNKNGRMYTKDSTMTIVDNFMVRRNAYGVAYGSIGYPSKGFEIGLNTISHSVDRLYEEDNILFADVRMLRNGMGPDLLNEIHRYVFRTNASGILVDTDGKSIVHLHDIMSVNAILKEDDSFIDQQTHYDNMLRIRNSEIKIKSTEGYITKIINKIKKIITI